MFEKEKDNDQIIQVILTIFSFLKQFKRWTYCEFLLGLQHISPLQYQYAQYSFSKGVQ